MAAGVASVGRLRNSELCTLRSSSPIVDAGPIDGVPWKMPQNEQHTSDHMGLLSFPFR